MELKSVLERASRREPLACVDFKASIDAVQFDIIETIEANEEGPVDGIPVFGTPGLTIEGNVATIRVRGLLVPTAGADMTDYGITGYDVIEAYVEAADASSANVTILDIDSGGGFVSGLSVAGNAIQGASNRVEARVKVMAASAAYWLACSAEKIVTLPDAVVGSIGAYIEHLDASEALKNEGLVSQIFKSDFWKGAFSNERPLSEREAEKLQAMVDETAQEFRSFVAERKGVSVADIVALEGDTISGDAALKAGLVDEVIVETNKTEAFMPQENAATEAATFTQEDMQVAIDAAVAKATADTLAKADERLKRSKAIAALQVPEDVRAIFQTEAFDDVSIDALTQLSSALPKTFSVQMEEEGGAGIQADPTEITPKTEAEAKEAKRLAAEAKLETLANVKAL